MKQNSKNLLAGASAVLLLGAISASNAQTASTAPSTSAPATVTVPMPVPGPGPRPCRSEAHRQFDFWIGDWDVTTPDGKPAGTNLIKLILANCVMHESWKTGTGFAGESYNVYDAVRKVWHQTWVDVGGTLLVLEGKFEGGAMTMSDRSLAGKNPNAINEIVWTPNADGSVSQRWSVSNDGGKTWKLSFDGRYVRAARPQPAVPVTAAQFDQTINTVERLGGRVTTRTEGGRTFISKLDLSRSTVTDAGIKLLLDTPDLPELDLRQTSVSDAGLVKLGQLEHL